MDIPEFGTIDKGDIFQINPDFDEKMAWSLFIAEEVYSWGVEGVLVKDLEALWLHYFKSKNRIAIGWDHLELIGHLKLGMEYESTHFKKAREKFDS